MGARPGRVIDGLYRLRRSRSAVASACALAVALDLLTASTASAGTTTFTQISAGTEVTCGITSDGAAECWGYGPWLGDGAAGDSAVPTAVHGLSSDVTSIAAGQHSACAVVSGAAKCWGYGVDGELGNGATANSDVPVDVVGLGSGVSSVSVGPDQACALTIGGGVKCWGYGGHGQLGNGSTSSNDMPVDVTGLGSGVLAISVGAWSSCAVLTSGAVKCWGEDPGDGTSLWSDVPVDVVGLSSGAVDVSAGRWTTCALLASGGVRCWGTNTGDGTNGSATAVDVTGLASDAVDISSGESVACAVLDTGAAQCWGWNDYGTIGDATTTSKNVPTDVLELAGVTEVASGGLHVCAIDSDLGASCWGYNGWGQLGNGTTVDAPYPVGVTGAHTPSTTCSLVLTVEPTRVWPKDTVTLTGTLVSGDGAILDHRLIRVDIANANGAYPDPYVVTTDATGAFSLVDHPAVDGPYTYTATWIPDVAHAAPEASSAVVTVHQKRSSLSVTVSRTVVPVETRVTISVHLGKPALEATTTKWVRVAASPRWFNAGGGGGTKKIFLDADGDGQMRVWIYWNTDVLATFNGDKHWASASASTKIYAVPTVNLRPIDPTGRDWSGRYTFPYSKRCITSQRKCPTFAIGTIPRGIGKRVTVRHWVRRGGAWVLVSVRKLDLDQTGRTTVSIPYRSPGIRGRVQRLVVVYSFTGYRRARSEPLRYVVGP